MNSSPFRSRAHLLLIVAVLASFGLFLSSVGAALAVHDIGVFELDDNALDGNGPTTAPDDWSALVPNNTSTSANLLATVFIADGNNPPADTTYFTGGGSKDTNNVNKWARTTNDQAPDKDEISNAYVAAYKSGSDLIIYFGADRFDNSGSSQIGFWFFKNPITLNNGTFSGVHANGDLLILSDFTQGGAISTIKAYKWLNGALTLIGSGLDCVSGTSPDTVSVSAPLSHL